MKSPPPWSRGLSSLVLLIAVGSALASTSCRSLPGSRIEARERVLGTTSSLARDFHHLVLAPQRLGPRCRAIVVGIEKTHRAKVGVPFGHGADDLFDAGELARWEALDRDGDEWAALVRRRFDDDRITFLSHIAETELVGADRGAARFRTRFLYDVYDESTTTDEEAARAFETGRAALLDLRGRIRTIAAEEGTTHVVLVVMGWHTRQADALQALDGFAVRIADAADLTGEPFRPLFIGVTWHSSWAGGPIGKGMSYGVKANDADEVGLLWLNHLLHDVLDDDGWPQGAPPIVVGVGHSFGARALGTAALSARLLGHDVRSSVDVLALLQGAFSVHRFLPDHTVAKEGAPFRDHAASVPHLFATWSRHDFANPLSNMLTGANHVGGRPGFTRAQDYPDHFVFGDLDGEGALTLGAGPLEERVGLVDASQIVNTAIHRSAGGAHSDVFTPEMARFLWTCISMAPR